MSAHNGSERAEQRRLREQMRGSGMSYAEVATEMARRYRCRPRKAWRVAWGWTLDEAAERYNALRAKGAEEAVTSLTGSRLSEWENWPLSISARKPSFLSLCLLAEIYRCPVLDLVDFRDREHLPPAELLALDKSAGIPTPVPAESGASEAEITLWRPAHIDVNGAFTPDDEERLILAARSPRRYDPRIVDALSTVLGGQRRTEDAIGSTLLVEPVKAQLAVVSNLVTEARGDLRTKVLDIGSQWAQFAGWLHANTRQLGEANRFYGLALEWALEADKPNMIATALNMQGHTAWLDAKAGPMIGLSRAAQRDNRASSGVRALAEQQEARAIALSGEAKIADIDRLFDHAQELVAQAAEKPENEPTWIYFFSPDYLVLQRGLAYRLLGQYAEANELLTAGLSALPGDMRQSEWVASHYLLQLAVNHAKSGDIGAAISLASEINTIARQTHSEGLRTALTGLHMRLSRKSPDDPRVAELGETLR